MRVIDEVVLLRSRLDYLVRGLNKIVTEADTSKFDLSFTMDGYANNPVDQWRYKGAKKAAMIAEETLKTVNNA